MYNPKEIRRLDEKHPKWATEPIIETFTNYARYVLQGGENAVDDEEDANAEDELDDDTTFGGRYARSNGVMHDY